MSTQQPEQKRYTVHAGLRVYEYETKGEAISAIDFMGQKGITATYRDWKLQPMTIEEKWDYLFDRIMYDPDYGNTSITVKDNA